MNIIKIIDKKIKKEKLSQAEIEYWIKGVTDESIADYQSTALLSAICCNGMDEEETFYLTKAMTDSGDKLDFSMIEGIKADKHSSGGVGDKTSMTLMPLMVACGLKAAKMSGGALGFMGGTTDKLSSIPNMKVFMDKDAIIKQVQEIGIAMCGQTGNLCPADKKLYALRDVTGCVSSAPLIVSSIMCKKLSCGDDVILLDVKYGDGSEMKTVEDAEELAKLMISVGEQYGKKIGACITSMEQPLGNAIGNALEVKEAIDTLHGKGPKDFTDLVYKVGSTLLNMSGLYSIEDAYRVMKENIDNGKASSLFKTMIDKQGGLSSVVDDTSLLPQAPYITEIKAKCSGYISKLKGQAIGEISMSLGAGRQKADDEIDYSVGIVLNKKIGDYVEINDTLASFHHNRPIDNNLIDKFYNAYEYSDTQTIAPDIIAKIL